MCVPELSYVLILYTTGLLCTTIIRTLIQILHETRITEGDDVNCTLGKCKIFTLKNTLLVNNEECLSNFHGRENKYKIKAHEIIISRMAKDCTIFKNYFHDI